MCTNRIGNWRFWCTGLILLLIRAIMTWHRLFVTKWYQVTTSSKSPGLTGALSHFQCTPNGRSGAIKEGTK